MAGSGTRAATSTAASMSSASNTNQPLMASRVPTKGPAVVTVLPASTRTVVAFSGRAMGSPGVTPGVWLSNS
jgi:hypothetical protein